MSFTSAVCKTHAMLQTEEKKINAPSQSQSIPHSQEAFVCISRWAAGRRQRSSFKIPVTTTKQMILTMTKTQAQHLLKFVLNAQVHTDLAPLLELHKMHLLCI